MTATSRSILLVCAVAAVTCFAGLGRAAITDADEAFYAESAREMVESGDWLSPRYNYENRWQKPILYYWGAAAAFTVAGVGEATARFPAALSGLGLALVTWWVGRRWYDERTGRLAGIVIGTSAGCVGMARQSLPDLPLAFFITVAIAGAFAWMFEDERPRPGALVVSAAAAGAAFLTKGPIGVLIPALVIGPLLLLEGRLRQVRAGHVGLGLIVAAAVAAPWYLAMWQVHGTAYLESFFLADNLERFATDRFNEPRPLWFYLPIVAAGLLPWSPFLLLWAPRALALARRRVGFDPIELRLFVWAVFPLLFFTASVGKQPRYILPMLTPLAVALARSLRNRIDAGAGRQALVRASGTTSGVALGVLGVVLVALPAGPVGVSEVVLTAGGIAVALTGAAVAAVAWWRPPMLPAAVAAGGVTLVVSLYFGLLSTPGPETVQLVAERVRAELRPGMAWTTHEVFVRNLVFYVGQRQAGPFTDDELVRFLDGPTPALAVISQTHLERLEPRLGRPVRRLAEWQYFNVAGLRARILLDPDPNRELRTAVLVSNAPADAF